MSPKQVAGCVGMSRQGAISIFYGAFEFLDELVSADLETNSFSPTHRHPPSQSLYFLPTAKDLRGGFARQPDSDEMSFRFEGADRVQAHPSQ